MTPELVTEPVGFSSYFSCQEALSLAYCSRVVIVFIGTLALLLISALTTA